MASEGRPTLGRSDLFVTANSSNWFLQLLGFKTDSIPENADVSLTWTNLPQSWQVFVLIAAVLGLVYIVGWLYARESDTCTRRVKVVLAGLRIAVVLVLLAVFLGPAITYSQKRTIPAQILVLRDASQSMMTADRYLDAESAAAAAAVLRGTGDDVRKTPPTGDEIKDARKRRPSRAEIVDRIFATRSGLLIEELKQHGRVQIADFSSNLTRHETKSRSASARPDLDPPDRIKGRSPAHQGPDGPSGPTSDVPTLASVANGQETNLYRALQEALAEKQLAAVVLFTDGQHTGGDDPVLIARRARELGVKLLIVGVGDPSSRKNLEISEIYADRQVFKGAEFEIQTLLRSEGYPNEKVQVELTERRIPANGGPPSEEKTVDSKAITIPPEGGQVRIAFSRSVDIPGRRLFSIRVERRPDEISQDDNQPRDPAEVHVLDSQARVLLVAGGPSWEYRGVQRLLQDDESVNLSCWMQTNSPARAQDGNTIITRLPETEDELGKYDVVLLFDPDPRDFDEKFVGLLTNFVAKKARGLMFLAGPKFSSRFLTEVPSRKLAEILPVNFGDAGRIQSSTLLATNTRPWPLKIVAANVDHPIMRFYPDPRATMELWNTLPGIFWSFPAESKKPGARTLIEHSDDTLRQVEGRRPLLVTSRHGAGRTAYIGFNGTWRWKSEGRNSEFFARFWLQSVRYLIEGRLLEGKRRGYVATERARYQRKDLVVVTAELNDPQSKPIVAPEITATVSIDGKPAEPVTLKPLPNRPGQYQATMTALNLGRHVLSIKLPDDPSTEPTITTAFFVAPPSAEIRDLRLNKAKLKQLADESGGKYFEMDQFLGLAAEVPDRSRPLEVGGKPLPLWDKAYLLGLLVVLLCVEWSVRKYFKLL
jgi:von Willebrand factor type A domain